MTRKYIKIYRLIILIVLASFSAAPAIAQYQSKLSNEQLIASIKKIRQEKLPGKFVRVSPEILKFEGYIDKPTYQEYQKQIDDKVKILLINSPGGDTNSGVKMGLDIAQRKLTVIVEGTAASSAANYLFLGGHKKVIARGFVAFHGNAQALVAQAGGFGRLKKEMKEKYKISDEYFEVFKKEMQETIKLEQEFFHKLNIPQKFFTITQQPGKGLSSMPGEEFDFLLPSLRTMEFYGINNVSGRQDVGFAEKAGIKVIYY